MLPTITLKKGLTELIFLLNGSAHSSFISQILEQNNKITETWGQVANEEYD